MNPTKLTARIVCAGEKGRLFEKTKMDYVIAADGGLVYLDEKGIKPDVAIGDFDSLGRTPQCENVIALPKEKDDTDTVAAVKFAIEKGCDEAVLYCAAGGEPDHTLANLSALRMLCDCGKRGFMYDKERIITVISGETVNFSENCEGKLSVYPFGDSAHVIIDGMAYSFDGVMTCGFPIGEGNSFIGKKAKISADRPTILIFSADIYENSMFTITEL